jgi:ribonucleoside-diphosphate reductase alpha chain
MRVAEKKSAHSATKAELPVVDYKDALAQCLVYFQNDDLAATTWLNKYAMRNAKGELVQATPNDMHMRMAREFARVEEKFRKGMYLNGSAKLRSAYGQSRKDLTESGIFELFKDFKYVIPQGSVMSALGNPYMIASLSNCVVLPNIHDSYGGVMYTDQQLTQLFKRRCGVGVDLSTLRPSGRSVSNAAGTTSGAVSFMERFSNTTREVAQNGRRGALMLTMDIAHPDVEDFITIKQDLKKVTGANISVRLSDEFMQAVAEDREYTHRWPVESTKPEVTKTIKARELWNTIINCAHNTAEPGLIFWDRQHHYSTSSLYPDFKNASTNPCSEIAMQGGDSCRLIAINLFSYVDSPFTKKAKFNFEKFYQHTYEAQRLQDDLVELELESIERILAKIDSDPEPDYIKSVERQTWQLLYDFGKRGRRTGLGFTALGDAVAALGLAYDSEASIAAIDKMMRTKLEAEFDSSVDMAIERGAFADFDSAIENQSEFVHMMKKEFPKLHERMMKHGRRNISISTVAPTGTLSMLAQTSSGIEPVFLLSYTRRRKLNKNSENAAVAFVDDMGDKWEEFTVYHPKLKNWMDITGEKNEEASPYYGSTAPEIDWMKRIEIQAVVQKYVTHSISSTINLPNEVSTDEVGQIYLEAWKKGLKGITVYRDGSRTGVLVDNRKVEANPVEEIVESKAPPRPERLAAKVVRFNNENEKWIGVVGLLNGKPYEIFTGRAEDSFYLPAYVNEGWVIKGREDSGISRYDFQYMDKDGYRVTIEGLSRSFNQEYWNYAKLISGVLRHGMPILSVVELIEDLNLYSEYMNTWKNGVMRTLKQFIPDGTKAMDKKCPSCGDSEGLVYEEGCLNCKSCGHSKCG